jgi:mannan endo-1,4-beta-mannosidase
MMPFLACVGTQKSFIIRIVQLVIVTYSLTQTWTTQIITYQNGREVVVTQHETTALQAASIYYGAYTGSWLQNLQTVVQFESSVQKTMSIVMWYQEWDNSVLAVFHPAWMNNVRQHGAIPMISWEPWAGNPNAVNVNSDNCSQTYDLQNIISGKFDPYIRQWAQSAKAWGYPFFLRFAPEMNGNWYPWSEQCPENKPGQYVQAWQHVHDIFNKVGADNVTWVWSPNVIYPGSTLLSELYPGNQYVDWVGIDGYNWSTFYFHQWQSFTGVFQSTYQTIENMALNKPMMVAQTASAGNPYDKSAWISNALTQALPYLFPAIKAMVYFNVNTQIQWSINSSLLVQEAFAHGISTKAYVAASSKLAALDMSPIPVPIAAGLSQGTSAGDTDGDTHTVIKPAHDTDGDGH